MLERANVLGASVTVFLYGLYILLFTLRLLSKPQLGHWLASLQFLVVFPLLYLLIKAPQLERPTLYYVQVCLLLIFLLVELVLDHVLKVDFRQTRWMVVSYITLFFAATGGLLGVAADAGRGWAIGSVILFFIMAILAFIQRAVTGM